MIVEREREARKIKLDFPPGDGPMNPITLTLTLTQYNPNPNPNPV